MPTNKTRRRQLSDISTYLSSVGLYAAHRGIKIVRLEISNAAYAPSLKTIVIDSEISDDSFELTLLLHELGHSTDPALVNEKGQVTKAYHALESQLATAKQRRLILKTEVRAWMSGRMIANFLDIPLGEWYSKAMYDSLKGYKDAA